MARVVEQAADHLTAHGRMLIAFGTSGDLDYLLHLPDRHGFAAEVVRDGWQVDDFVYRVALRG